MGIYGFLSDAYQETYQKLIVNENQIEFLENKAKFYEDDVTRYDEELERISNNISTLSNAKATSIQVRDTTSSTGLRSTISTAELRLAQQRIEVEEENRKEVNARRTIAADSLQKYRLDILELQNNSAVAGELGPLQYLSGLTGTPMDKIINWLLLVIIFVFDPLAISLVVAANFAFAQAFPKKEEDINWEDEEDDFNPLPSDAEAELYPAEEKVDLSEINMEEAEKRMDIIGQNGNDGLHYDDTELKEYVDSLKSEMVNQQEVEEQYDKIIEQDSKIKQLESELEDAHEEINELDRAGVKIIDAIKHINDYLKHHAPYYDNQGVILDDIKLGFAEKDDYIDKDNDNIITY